MEPKLPATDEAARLKAIFDSAVDYAIVATDVNGLVTNWNFGAEAIFGWSAIDMTGQSAERFFTCEDRRQGQMHKEMAKSLTAGRADDERWHLRKDGTRFWASGEMMPVRSSVGVHIGFLKIVRDRTEAQEAQAKQAADAEFMREVLASSNDCIKVLDLDARLEFMSDGGQKVMEVSDFNQLRGCAWPDFWEGEAKGQVLAAVAAARGGGVGRFQGPANTAAGNPRYWDVQVTPIPGPDGVPAKLLSISRDITDSSMQKKAIEELNATLEQKVLDQARERSVVWKVSLDLLGGLNSKGYFETCNPAWYTLLGWSEKEVTSMSIFEMLHPDDVERTRAGFELTQQGQPAIYFTNRYRHKDGSYRWISWVGVPEGELVYCIGRDITGEKQAAASLEIAQEQLRQSQKMEAVGQLTGGLAHDFNNFLAIISNSLELLRRRAGKGDIAELDRYLDMAQGASKRAAALTHRMLAFSRRQTLDPKATDINRLIAGMEDMARRAIGHDIALEVVGLAGLWTVNVDRHQLESALLNLCINARDAMPHGGRLTIESANKWMDERNANERLLKPGQYVSICVTDTGTGIDANTQKRIFEPFYTTKPIGEGTGLGLSMVYGFAAQSGGQVRVYSEVGMGTTMCIYLPRFRGEAALEETLPPVGPAIIESARVVLVVDDEPTVRTIVCEVMKDLGNRCLEAEDGAKGLSILRSATPIDLLITDVGLPGGMNGRQLADAARQFRPELKILFITGYAENAVVGNGHLDPGMEILTKPFEIDALAARASGMLSRH